MNRDVKIWEQNNHRVLTPEELGRISPASPRLELEPTVSDRLARYALVSAALTVTGLIIYILWWL